MRKTTYQIQTSQIKQVKVKTIGNIKLDRKNANGGFSNKGGNCINPTEISVS